MDLQSGHAYLGVIEANGAAFEAHPEYFALLGGIRPIERQAEARAAAGDERAQAVMGYCSAVRSAITDDGRPPLDASGLKLHERLTAVSASLAEVEGTEGRTPCRSNCGS